MMETISFVSSRLNPAVLVMAPADKADVNTRGGLVAYVQYPTFLPTGLVIRLLTDIFPSL